jgi:hypothetical protein
MHESYDRNKKLTKAKVSQMESLNSNIKRILETQSIVCSPVYYTNLIQLHMWS